MHRSTGKLARVNRQWSIDRGKQRPHFHSYDAHGWIVRCTGCTKVPHTGPREQGGWRYISSGCRDAILFFCCFGAAPMQSIFFLSLSFVPPHLLKHRRYILLEVGRAFCCCCSQLLTRFKAICKLHPFCEFCKVLPWSRSRLTFWVVTVVFSFHSPVQQHHGWRPAATGLAKQIRSRTGPCMNASRVGPDKIGFRVYRSHHHHRANQPARNWLDLVERRGAGRLFSFFVAFVFENRWHGTRRQRGH